MNPEKFSVPISSDTTLSLSRGTCESEFFDRAGLDDTGAMRGKYVITKQYWELLIHLNTPGRQRIVLRGPKGVGKSVTLGALAANSIPPTLVYCVGAKHLLINMPIAPQPAKRAKVEDTGESLL